MKRILLLLFTLVTLAGYAQYPITSISINLSANPPANTADWATVMPPVMITAQAQLRNGQMNGDVIESKILVTIKQGGSKKYGSYTPDNAPSAGFTTAVKNWSGNNAITLLGSAATLPPGSYELCVQFFSYNAPAKPLSNEVCKTFTIADAKPESYTPPVNVNPVDKKIFTGNEIKSPITFRWSPLCCIIRNPPNYRINVWQVGEGKDAAQVMQTEQPVISEMVKAQTQFTYRKGWDGKGNYVWRVEAIDGQGKVLGTSEATSFGVSTDGNYTPPVNESPADKKIFTEKEIKSPITFRWTPILPRPQGPVIYKLKVWQIKEGQKGPQVMKVNKPVVEKEVKDASQFVKQNLMGDIEMVGGSANLIWNVQAVDEKGNVMGSSEPTSFSAGSNCTYDFKLSVTSVECLGSQNGLNNYKVCINSYFQSSTLNLTYLITGSGISASHPSYSPTYVVSAITPALTPQTSGAASNKAYCFNVAVPVGQTSLRIGLQGDDNNPSPIITCQPGGDTLINLPSCKCDLCDKPNSTWEILDQMYYDSTRTNNILTLHNDISFSPYKIVKLSAEVVDFYWYTEGDCKKCTSNDFYWGNLISGSMSGSNFTSGVSAAAADGIPLPSSHQLDFLSNNPAGANLSNDVYLNISLPPQTQLSCCTDCFRFCVRYTVTFMQNGVCKTCSIVKCYETKRRHKKTLWQLATNQCGDKIILNGGGLLDASTPVLDKKNN